MNSLVIIFSAIVATVLSVPLDDAERYPANLSPALCPNYPICDNSLIHGTPDPMPSLPLVEQDVPMVPMVPMPSPQLPAVPLPAFNPALLFPTFVATAWPEGVHPAACPNYPYCNSVSKIVVPLPGFTQRLYPPGVHPAACPNYPEC